MTIHHKIMLGLIAGALFSLAMALSAFAQIAICGDRAEIIEDLSKRYHETRQAGGVVTDKGIAELYVSGEGTWTFMVTLNNGKSCIIAAGDAWDDPATPKPGRGI